MFSAIIPAAGSGRRMGKSFNKLLLPFGEGTLLESTLRVIAGCPLVAEVILAVQETDWAEIETLAAPFGARLVLGGATRQESVSRALLEVRQPYVLVHDGARPLIPPEKVLEVAETAVRTGAAILAVPIKDTVKKVAGGVIERTIPREGLWAAQTPQAFLTEILRDAYRLAGEEHFEGTDEASLVEYFGHPVAVIEGSEKNLKVTTPLDLAIAEYLCHV